MERERGKKEIYNIIINIVSVIIIKIFNRYIDNKNLILKLMIGLNIINILMYTVNIYINKYIIINIIDINMLILIDYVGLLVIIYSKNYMNLEENKYKYLNLIFEFILIMKLLILSSNLFLLFFFWELIGYMSYKLINYWNNSIYNNKAAIKAIIYNRIGDVCYIYIIVKYEIEYTNTNYFFITSLTYKESIFLLLFVFIKSAQFFSFPWLLYAMSTPTPTSALLHAATMVCAGIYILIKYNLIILQIPIYISILLTILISLSLLDLKRFIAISTANNIGLMFISKKSIAMLHMLSHGLYKSILFFISGVLIHISYNQDLRKLQGLFYKNPLLIKIFYSILFPLPYFMIFYTKELILINTNYLITYIIIIINTIIYISNSKRLFHLFLNTPSFSFYIKSDSSINLFYLFTYLFSFLSSIYIYSYITITSFSYIDLIPIFLLLSKQIYIPLDLLKHFEILLNSSLKWLLHMSYKFYYLHVDTGYLEIYQLRALNLIRIKY